MPHVDLLTLPYFDGISLDDLVALIDKMKPAQFAAGARVLTEGDETQGSCLWVVTSGRLAISKSSPGGGVRRLAELDAPTLFGEIELFCDVPPVCSVEALTSVAAFALDASTFEAMAEANSPMLVRFAVNVARVACHRLAIADEMLAQVLTDEDLCDLRRRVWGRVFPDRQVAAKTTGVFRLRDLRR
jgi:CRP-like cAMP-binding protein